MVLGRVTLQLYGLLQDLARMKSEVFCNNLEPLFPLWRGWSSASSRGRLPIKFALN